MNAIIFGANGQDGYYLSSLCREKGIDPIGVSRSGTVVKGDVSDYQQVESLIKTYQPEFIFHLAANSSTRHDRLFENHATISTGTINILESARLFAPRAKIFITGSGVQFKNSGKPISETDEFLAKDPYSVARIHSVYAARYFRNLGMNVYVGYLFHHESPFRKPTHVSQMIVSAVKRIAEGSLDKIEIGNVKVEKEWTFAGDVADGIITLLEQDKVFEAVIGSGIGYTIENWLYECFRLIGKDWHDHVTIQEGFVAEYDRLISNPKTINSLGWFPTVSLKNLAELMIAYTS